MTPTERRQAILTLIAGRLEMIRADLMLKQYGVGYGRVSPSTAHNVLKGKDHKISTLVEIADSMDCDVVIEIRRRNEITQTNESIATIQRLVEGA